MYCTQASSMRLLQAVLLSGMAGFGFCCMVPAFQARMCPESMSWTRNLLCTCMGSGPVCNRCHEVPSIEAGICHPVDVRPATAARRHCPLAELKHHTMMLWRHASKQ